MCIYIYIYVCVCENILIYMWVNIFVNIDIYKYMYVNKYVNVWLVACCGISTLIAYLMPNPVVHIYDLYTDNL